MDIHIKLTIDDRIINSLKKFSQKRTLLLIISLGVLVTAGTLYALDRTKYANGAKLTGDLMQAIVDAVNTNIDKLTPVTVSSGNMGINQTSPAAALDIKGLGATGSTTALNVSNSSGTALLEVENGGNVGIGTTTPGATLDVNGSARVGSSLAVVGATSLSNILSVVGTTTLSNTLSVVGATTLSNTLSVAGTTTTGTLYHDQPIAFHAYRTTSVQTITTDTNTKMQLNAEKFDDGNNFDSVTNYRFVAPRTGKYFVTGSVRGSNSFTGAVVAKIYVDGSQYAWAVNGATNAGGGGVPTCTVSTVINLTANSYVELYVFHDRGVNLDIVAEVESVFMTGFYIGD